MWEEKLELLNCTFILLVITLVAAFVFFQNPAYYYWKSHGVPCEKPSTLVGNAPFKYFFGKLSAGELLRKSYEKFKNYPFHGFCITYQPVLMVNDPELVKVILIKEFQRFSDRGLFTNEKIDPMTTMLFLQKFDEWKRLRGKFSPAFAPSKLKQYYPLIKEIGDKMIEVCDKKLRYSDTLEIRDLLGRYFTDIISSVVYGFNGDSLNNENSEFRCFGRKALEIGRFKMPISTYLPILFEITRFPFFDRKISKFFTQVFNESVEYRREKKIVRNDFLNALMQLMDTATIESDDKSPNARKRSSDRLTKQEACAEAFSFFLAGFETSTSTTIHCLLEMIMNPEMQEILQNEIDKYVDSEEGLTYDSIMQMEYLDMVLNETTRKHAALEFFNRICTEDYPIPNSNFVIPKGMRILISVRGIQNNHKYFPDPERFDPSRFDKKSPTYRESPAYLAFGAGPRNCIAGRLGSLQIKQAIISLLYNYKFELSEKTKMPIEYCSENMVRVPKHGIYLKVERRNKIIER